MNFFIAVWGEWNNGPYSVDKKNIFENFWIVFFVVINKQLDSGGIQTIFNTWNRTFSIQNKLIKLNS